MMKKFFSGASVLLLYLIVISTVSFAGTEEERPIDKVYYTNGDLFSSTDLFSDRNNGFYNTYHHNGALATTTIYQDGLEIVDKAFDEQGKQIKRNGTFKTYYADGTVASSGTYRKDLKNGTFKFFYYDGKTVVDVWHYLNGHKVGEHIRNDEQGKFRFREDLRYPSYYVRHLENTIMILCGMIFLYFLSFFFYKKAPAKQ